MGGNLSLEQTSLEEVSGLREVCLENDAAFTIRFEVFKFTPTIDPNHPNRNPLLRDRDAYDITQCDGLGRVSGGLSLKCISLADCDLEGNDGFVGTDGFEGFATLRWGYSLTQVDVPEAKSVSQQYRNRQYNYDPNGHRLRLTCTGANGNGYCTTDILN